MKRIFYGIVCLASLLFSGCSNQQPEITTLDSEITTLDSFSVVDGEKNDFLKTISLFVDPEIESVDMKERIVVQDGVSLRLYRDGTEEEDAIASLNRGNNGFDLQFVTEEDVVLEEYELLIYRSFYVDINYICGSATLYQDHAPTGYEYTLIDPKDVAGCDVTAWLYGGKAATSFTPWADSWVIAEGTPSSYEITLDCAGGALEGASSLPVTFGEAYELPAPTREGYTFIGWYEGESKIPDTGFWSTPSDKTYTAHYEAISYAITYEMGKGRNNPDNPYSYTIEDEVTLADPTKAGYVFAGWTDADGNPVPGVIEPGSIGEVTFVATWAFDGFEYREIEGGYEIRGVPRIDEFPKVLEIPASFQGKPIIAIADGGFENWRIKSLILPDSIVRIGDDAFRSCHIASISWPSSLKEIGSYAFYNSAIAELILPAGVTDIGECAFMACQNLVRADLGSSLVNIGNDAFCTCVKLETVSIPNTVQEIGSGLFSNCSLLTYYVQDGLAYLGSPDHPTSWCCGPAKGAEARDEYVIADGCRIVRRNAFYDRKGIVSIALPETVETIYDSAFSGCTALSHINIPAALSRVEENAFKNCSSLVLHEEDGLSYMGNADRPHHYLVSAQDQNITEATIPEDCVIIGGRCFSGCKRLSSLRLPDSVAFIGEYAFANCISLSSFAFPASLAHLRGGAFANSGLSSVEFPSSLRAIPGETFKDCAHLSSVTFHPGLKEIFYDAFRGCSSLKAIDLPASVKSIGPGAFMGCCSLEEAELPDGLLLVRPRLFSGCAALSSVKLPRYATSIGSEAFLGCAVLTGIDFPETLQTIGESAFAECTSLLSVELPATVESLDQGVFYGCTSLQSAVLPSSLTNIPESLFQNCASLEDVAIPRSVDTIELAAFYLCTSLTSIVIPATVANIYASAFANCVNLTVYCEAESLPPDWDSSWANGVAHVVWGYRE